MIEEIAGGLKNALERGASLDQAVQSFINAGYNPVEVRQAAQSLSYIPQTIKPANVSIGQQSYQTSQMLTEMQQAEKQRISANMAQSQANQSSTSNNFMQSQRQNQSLDNRLQRVKPKSKRGFLIGLLLAILLLLVGGLVYVIFFGQKLLESILGA